MDTELGRIYAACHLKTCHEFETLLAVSSVCDTANMLEMKCSALQVLLSYSIPPCALHASLWINVLLRAVYFLLYSETVPAPHFIEMFLLPVGRAGAGVDGFTATS